MLSRQWHPSSLSQGTHGISARLASKHSTQHCEYVCNTHLKVPYHAALLLIVAKGERQVAEGLRAGLNRHGLVVLETVILHSGMSSADALALWDHFCL